MSTQRTGHAVTARAARYGKQLCSHFGRKRDANWHDNQGHVTFDTGTCYLEAADDRLLIRVEASEVDDRDRLAAVVDRHLVRFGSRNELIVQWQQPLEDG